MTDGAYALMWDINAYKISIRKNMKGKYYLGDRHNNLEDNIKLHLRYTRCYGVDRIQLAHNTIPWPTLVEMVMKVRVP
jgi:hypothetical protein